MNQIAPPLLILFSALAIFSISRAQVRAPHGLAYESPVAFAPSAVDFFHPKSREPETKDHCSSSKCSPLPLAAQVEATEAYESKVSTSQKSGSGLTAGGIAGIVVASTFVVLVAMGAYYVAVTRRANVNRANSAQPNAWSHSEQASQIPLPHSNPFLIAFFRLCLLLVFQVWDMECTYDFIND